MSTVDHWTSHRSEIRSRLGARPLALFLDFDGTLVPLRAYDKESSLSVSVKRLLNELADHPAIQVSIVSGRPLSDLRCQVKNPRIFLAGNHGFEIQGPRVKFLHPAASRTKKLFRSLSGELRQQLQAYAGVLLEDKTYTLTIHYRGVSRACEKKLQNWLRNWLREQSRDKLVSLQTGKKVFEIKPRANWHKGAAMRRILSVYPGKSPMAVYIGDDLTDEDALQRLPSSGWGFKVTSSGKEATAARSFLRNPAEVKKCLLWFKSLVK